MGLKKKLMLKFAQKVAQKAVRSKGAKKHIGKAIAILILAGFLFTIAIIAFLGFTFSQVSNLVSKDSNVEFVALEKLISEGEIVLSEGQEALALPLLKDIVTNENLAPVDIKNVENQILDILTPPQLEVLSQRQDQIIKETNFVKELGIIADNWLGQYTELSIEEMQKMLADFQVWWSVKDPSNEAPKNLLEQIEKQ